MSDGRQSVRAASAHRATRRNTAAAPPGKRVLLTGAAGFVGANLARRLLDDGHEVHALVRPGFQGWRLRDVRSRLQLHRVELSDVRRLDHLVAETRPQWVFHLATYGAYPEQTDQRRMAETNVAGTIDLVNACAKIGFEAFVNAGSSSEYGFKDHAPPEKEALEPNSLYAVTKAAASLYCQFAGMSRGLPIVTLRLYSVFGPFEEPSRLIPTLILRGLEGALPPLVGPEIARDFVYVDDAVEAFVLAAARQNQQPGVVYNVGSGVQTTMKEIVELARTELGLKVRPQWGSMAPRSWDTTIWLADTRRIRSSLGWRARMSFAQGFRLTLDWFRRNWPLPAFGRVR